MRLNRFSYELLIRCMQGSVVIVPAVFSREKTGQSEGTDQDSNWNYLQCDSL